MPTLKELLENGSTEALSDLLGKSILVGVWQFFKDELHNGSQIFGKIAGFENGYLVVENQEKRALFPVQVRAILPAPKGTYTLVTTGEEIIDPDYLLSWRLDLLDNVEASQWQANSAPHIESIVGKEWEFNSSTDKSHLEAAIKSHGSKLIGKSLLVGVRTYGKQADGRKELLDQTQVFGIIVRVSIGEGIVLELAGTGEEYLLPPDITWIQPALPGEYRLRSTGEIITDPDYMTMWARHEKLED